MLNRVRISTKPLAIIAMAFSLFFVSPGLFAAEGADSPAVHAAQPMDLTAFLNTLGTGNQNTGDQGLAGNRSLLPAPENKVIYCSYQACPSGQRCWYCHSNWVCIYNYPDPDQVPPGCSGGPV